MSSLLAVLDRYPGLWSILGPALAGLVWAVVSGLFNSVYDSRSPHTDEEWAAAFITHPRWAAVVGVFKTAGLNLPGLLRALRAFFGGALPAPVLAVVSGPRPPAAVALREAARLILVEEVRQASVSIVPPPFPDPPKDAA